MKIALVVLGIAAVIAIGIAAAIYERRKERERSDALRALADQLGFDFRGYRDESHDELFSQFSVFRQGFDRAAYNTIEGRTVIDGRSFGVRMGDYRYKVRQQTGKTSTVITYSLSYCILMLPWRGTPRLLIRPERFLDKITGAIGFDDIDFESAEFSRKFFVKSSDKRFAYDVVTPAMMEFLLARRDLLVDLEGDCCLFTDGIRRWKPPEFRAALNRLAAFFDLWPEHILADLDARAA